MWYIYTMEIYSAIGIMTCGLKVKKDAIGGDHIK
jgi:hypothetical protein